MEQSVHLERFKKAVQDEKLLLIQYSSTDINNNRLDITSFFALNYFTDEEYSALDTDTGYRMKIKEYFINHSDHYFAFWNYNINYGIEKLDVLDDKEKELFNDKVIDLDEMFESYAKKNNMSYVVKRNGGFDTRYYLAILNNLHPSGDWITGSIEKDIKNSTELLASSRAKVHITSDLIKLLTDKKIKLEYNKEVFKKSTAIIGGFAKVHRELRDWDKLVLRVLKWLFSGLSIGILGNWIWSLL